MRRDDSINSQEGVRPDIFNDVVVVTDKNTKGPSPQLKGGV